MLNEMIGSGPIHSSPAPEQYFSRAFCMPGWLVTHAFQLLGGGGRKSRHCWRLCADEEAVGTPP
jgi:hypothetical protein